MNTDKWVVRVAHGVKLVDLDQMPAREVKGAVRRTTMTDLFSLPMCVHFTDEHNRIQIISPTTAELCGFHSVEDAIGRTLIDVSEKQSALTVINNCQEVMKTKSSKIYEEKVTRRDEVLNHCISIKLPWYNDENKIIGVFGCTAVLGVQPLNHLFEKVVTMGVLNPVTLNDYQLSSRQLECLQHLVSGYTAKEIAIVMNLSVRTVEHYLDAVKIKMHCRSRLELVKKAAMMF